MDAQTSMIGSYQTQDNIYENESGFTSGQTYENLNDYFSQQDQQLKAVQEAREILGDTAQHLSDSEVYDLVNQVQFLVDTWLEEYERETFDGKTLNELLG